MATIKQELDDAALECGLNVPASWLSASDATAVQVTSIMRAVVEDVLDRHDWSGAAGSATISPVSEQSAWSFPADYVRLQTGDASVFEVSPNRRPIICVASDGSWNEMTAWGWGGAQRFYRLTGTGLEFYRPLPAGAVVKIAYQTPKWIVGGLDAWATEASDKPVFPSRLLRLGVIYRWRKQKGMRYADDMAEYETALARAISEDAPRRSFSTDGKTGVAAHPMRVPVPDVIGGG